MSAKRSKIHAKRSINDEKAPFKTDKEDGTTIDNQQAQRMQIENAN